MAIQTTYLDRLPIGYAGQLADMGLSDIMSREVEPASIGFGLAVIQGTGAHQCKLGAGGVFLGITVKDITLPADNADLYTTGDTAAIMFKGSMLVTASGTVAAGNPVYRSAAGALAATQGVATATPAAKSGGNTGGGTITMDITTPVGAGAKEGVYTVRCIAAASNSGTFRVLDPDGFNLGDIAVGGTFDNDIKFVIADVGTDFIVGDGFDVTVAIANDLIANAMWETGATNGNLARLRLR